MRSDFWRGSDYQSSCVGVKIGHDFNALPWPQSADRAQILLGTWQLVANERQHCWPTDGRWRYDAARHSPSLMANRAKAESDSPHWKRGE
jgi:hypothetical protein